MDWHTLFIILHAVTASVCLLAGLILLWLPIKKYRRLFLVFFWSIVILVISVFGAVVSHWTEIDITAKLTFSGLIILGIYMIYRGIGAKNSRSVGHADKYIDDVGFVIISLFVGLVIVPLIRLDAPAWLFAIAIGLTILAGNRLIWFAQKRSKN